MPPYTYYPLNDIESLERNKTSLIDSIADLNDMSELDSHKHRLIGEIGDLEEENSSLLDLVRNIKIKVRELEKLYVNLKQLAELDGDERGYDDCEKRENIMFNVRLLLERYPEE